MIAHLNRMSEWVLGDAESRTTSEALISEVLADFGGGAVFLLVGELEGASLKLVVTTDPAWLASGEPLVSQILKQREGEPRGPGSPTRRAPSSVASGRRRRGSSITPSWRSTAATRCSRPSRASRPRSGRRCASLSALGHLLVLGLVHHVGWYEPILPGHPGQQDLTLDPTWWWASRRR